MSAAAASSVAAGGVGSSESYSRGLRYSLGAHGLILLIALLKSLVFPGNPIVIPPALRVDIVGLPDVLKKDLIKVPTAPAPDKPAPEEAKPHETIKELKPLPPVKETVKQKPAPPPKEMAEPDEMVLKPRETTKTREKKMKSALDRIRALEKIKDDLKGETKKTKPSGMVVKGNQISKGSSLSPDARESAIASYYDTIRDRLQSNWALPVWLARQKLSAQINLKLDGAGRVSGLQITRASGNAQFDEAVRRAVQQSSPFPPPPADIAGSIAASGVQVGFPL